MKRKTHKLLATLALLFCGPLSGYDPCCDPTFDLCYSACCGAFAGGGEILYFRPCVCDLNFLIEDTREADEIDRNALPKGDQRAINPSYQFGFRLWLGYVFEDGRNDVRAQYSVLHRKDRSRILPPKERVIWPTFGQPHFLNLPLWSKGEIIAESSARSHLEYDSFEFQLGHKARFCHAQLRPYASLQFVNIERHFDANYEGFSTFLQIGRGSFKGIVNTKRKVWAVGPYIGIEALRKLFCGFGLGGRFGIGVLGGRTWADQEVIIEEKRPLMKEPVRTELKVHERSHCKLIPTYDLRGGVNYTWYCEDCFLLVAELGYEFLTYINALDRLTFNDLEGTAQITCAGFTLHGVYLSVRLQF